MLAELSPRGWGLLAAATYGLVALIVGVALTSWFFSLSMTELLSVDGGLSPLALVMGATVGGAVLGGLSWYWLVESSNGHRLLRGTASGLLTGVLGHFVMWFFHGIWVSTLGDWFKLIASLFFYLPFSLLLFGWISGIVGAAIGITLAYTRRAVEQAGPSQADRVASIAPGPLHRWVPVAMTGFGFTGLVSAGTHTVLSPGPSFDLWTIVPSTLLAATIGGLLWWRFIERTRIASANRGIAVGAGVAVFTPVATAVIWVLRLLFFPVAPLSGPLATSDVAGFLAFALVFSLGRIGLLAIPIGAVVGYALARRRGRNTSRPEPTATE